MKRRLGAALLLLAGGACGGDPPEPPALAYGENTVDRVSYEVADRTVVNVSAMGQSLEFGQDGRASFGVVFRPSASGVGVTLSVEDLEAVLSQPMGAPLRVDEGSVAGALTFTLDRRGGATEVSGPEVRPEASQMVSGLALANTFFPGLPGRAAVPGESWVDTVRYRGTEGAGELAETSILRYTVVGDTVVDERPLLHITMTGTADSDADLTFSGVNVTQKSELVVEGHVLWDYASGVMFERVRRTRGTGTVSIPIMPVPLPITIESEQRARLLPEGS